MTDLCPTCTGPRIERHPNGFGWLHQTVCALRDADDATIANDAECWQPGTRATTTTERTLLAACGITIADDVTDAETGEVTRYNASTDVALITRAVLNRTFRHRTAGTDWTTVDLDPDDGAP